MCMHAMRALISALCTVHSPTVWGFLNYRIRWGEPHLYKFLQNIILGSGNWPAQQSTLVTNQLWRISWQHHFGGLWWPRTTGLVRDLRTTHFRRWNKTRWPTIYRQRNWSSRFTRPCISTQSHLNKYVDFPHSRPVWWWCQTMFSLSITFIGFQYSVWRFSGSLQKALFWQEQK